MKCENCSHAEMCKWIDELEGRGCDFGEPCEDAISREYLFKVLDDFCGHDRTATIMLDTLADIVYELPSVTQKSGKWIRYKDNCLYNQCSYCGASHCREDNYCPNCGAKMESEDKE